MTERSGDTPSQDPLPAGSRPAGPEAPDARMPVPVRVAVVVLGVLAALFVLNGGLQLLGRQAVADNLLARAPGQDRQALVDLVTFLALRDLVVGLLAAVSAIHLGRRRSWARWTGIAAALLVALLTLLAGAQNGGVTLFSLLALVLSVAVVTSLFTRPATAWLPPRRPAARD